MTLAAWEISLISSSRLWAFESNWCTHVICHKAAVRQVLKEAGNAPTSSTCQTRGG
jgi:hypothetical protein